jgi:hypothetical protein
VSILSALGGFEATLMSDADLVIGGSAVLHGRFVPRGAARCRIACPDRSAAGSQMQHGRLSPPTANNPAVASRGLK